MNQTYEYVATCLFGLESLLGEEIEALGYERLETIDGRVTFRGDLAAIARCNLWLRFAERLYIKMGSFRASTFTELFDGTNSLPWENWIGKDDAFPVKGHSVKSTLTSIPDCQSIVKKAIVNRLSAEYGISWFKEDGVKYQIEFFILKDTATLMIDTSGIALHKRGYRPAAGVAPGDGERSRIQFNFPVISAHDLSLPHFRIIFSINYIAKQKKTNPGSMFISDILKTAAALLFTAGFAHALNGIWRGLHSAGATLTVALYVYAKEQGEFGVAFAIAAILMVLALLINLAAICHFTAIVFYLY